MFHLFTTAYRTTNPGRREELDKALRSNVTAFDSVHVLSEGEFAPDWFSNYAREGCEWWIQHKRQTVAELIALAQRCEPKDVVILANSDIEFTWPDLMKMNDCLLHDEAYCLSRWDYIAQEYKRDRKNGELKPVKEHTGIRLFDRDDSQDAWVFRGPPKTEIGGEYPFGVPGVDNRLAHDIAAAGYRVLNPSKTIRSYHPHVSGERLCNKPELRLPLPYLFVKPHVLGAVPEYRRPTKLSKRASSIQV